MCFIFLQPDNCWARYRTRLYRRIWRRQCRYARRQNRYSRYPPIDRLPFYPSKSTETKPPIGDLDDHDDDIILYYRNILPFMDDGLYNSALCAEQYSTTPEFILKEIENIFIDVLPRMLSDIHNEYAINIYEIPDIPIDSNRHWRDLSILAQKSTLLAFLKLRGKIHL
jgi:hypothetical protein